MGRSMYLALVALALGVADAQAPSNQHAGRVIDSRTHAGVQARITAYSSDKLDAGSQSDPCPVYQGRIGVAETDGNGNFTLKTEKTPLTYVGVVCARQYVTHTDTTLQNSGNENVIPVPVVLVQTSARNDYEHYRELVDAQVRAFYSQMRYYRRVNGDLFNRALKDGAEKDSLPAVRAMYQALADFPAGAPSK